MKSIELSKYIKTKEFSDYKSISIFFKNEFYFNELTTLYYFSTLPEFTDGEYYFEENHDIGDPYCAIKRRVKDIACLEDFIKMFEHKDWLYLRCQCTYKNVKLYFSVDSSTIGITFSKAPIDEEIKTMLMKCCNEETIRT